MPKIEDYRLAKCSLFRIPELDMTSVDGKLEELLVQAWKNGKDANSTIGGILGNQALIDQLAQQVQDSLSYQAEHKISLAEEERLAREEEAKRKREENLARIKARYQTKLSQEEASANEALTAQASTTEAYSASQKRLEQLREEARKKLEELGGYEGLKQLEQIKQLTFEEVEEDRPKPSNLRIFSDRKKRDLSVKPVSAPREKTYLDGASVLESGASTAYTASTTTSSTTSGTNGLEEKVGEDAISTASSIYVPKEDYSSTRSSDSSKKPRKKAPSDLGTIDERLKEMSALLGEDYAAPTADQIISGEAQLPVKRKWYQKNKFVNVVYETFVRLLDDSPRDPPSDYRDRRPKGFGGGGIGF